LRRRPAIAATVLAAITALGGCGESGGGGDLGTRPLVWVEAPRALDPPGLPDDRIVTGTVRNESLEPVELTAAEVRVVDAERDALDGSVAFLSGFVKPIEPANSGGPDPFAGEDLARLGRELTLDPGKTAPLTVSWRQPEGAPPAVAIDYRVGSLPLP
jgi:hypothetical protein